MCCRHISRRDGEGAFASGLDLEVERDMASQPRREGGASGEERGNKGTSDKTGRDETKRKGKETEKGGAGVKGRLRC